MKYQMPPWPPEWPEIQDAVVQACHSGDWGRYHSVICEDMRARLEMYFTVPGRVERSEIRLCCSGNAALELALRAAKVGPGDEVVISAYDYPGNLRTIELLGAKPVLIDVSSPSFSFDPRQLRAVSQRADSKAIRAVIVSHLFGEVVDTQAMRSVCDEANWVLIEDVCQSLGARTATHNDSALDPVHAESPSDILQLQGRLAGTWGHLATFSFGGSKPLSAGAGGALLFNDSRLLAGVGSWLERPGEVYPFSPLQAAVLQPQLDRLEELQKKRNETWFELYRQRCGDYSRWRWMLPKQQDLIPNPYKIAWLAESMEARDKVIHLAAGLGLPIGAGYRSFAKLSERRCRKFGSYDKAAELGKCLFVLDHRALLVGKSGVGELVTALDEIYQQLDS